MPFTIKNRFTSATLFHSDTADNVRDCLLEALKSGVNLYGVNLYGVNLSGADLSRANLSRANLSGANLSGVNLYGVNLSGADLSGADLSGANLSGANLSGADLSRANLSRADLSRADLSRANLSGANLSGRCFAQVSFSGHGQCGRMLTALLVSEKDTEPTLFCGCFKGTAAELKTWIAEHEPEHKASRTLALRTVLKLYNVEKV